MNPVLRYFSSALIAAAVYAVFAFGTIWYSAQSGESGGVMLEATVLFATMLLLTIFLPALGMIILPWTAVVHAHRKLGVQGPVSHATAGASLVLVAGCAISSLAPKPLFIEDQTFLEGVMIAAERQGAALLAAGLTFGLTFWRLRRS